MKKSRYPITVKPGVSSVDLSLVQEVTRLSTEVANMKFKTRVLEAKIFLMESEHDMLVRMLRTTRALRRNQFIRLENLLDPLYNLVQPDGKINAVLTVSRYGEEPPSPEQGAGGGISGAGEPVPGPVGDPC